MKIKLKLSLFMSLMVLFTGLWLYKNPPYIYSPLSFQNVWDQAYLASNPSIKEKIMKFEKGELCQKLRQLDTKNLPHQEILKSLKNNGFKCVVRPLSAKPSDPVLSYLKVDNTTTHDPNETGVARQEICQDSLQPECVIRIKRDGFPLNRRSAPHSSKAVLLDGKGDPGSYDNEAFKVGWQGQVLPKGPSPMFGLKKCPYGEDKKACDQWVDAIMEEAHPALKEPVGGDAISEK